MVNVIQMNKSHLCNKMVLTQVRPSFLHSFFQFQSVLIKDFTDKNYENIVQLIRSNNIYMHIMLKYLISPDD